MKEVEMNRIATTFFLLSAFLVAPRWLHGAGMGADDATQVDPSLTAGADKYLKAVLAGDAGSVAAMFREDGTLMPADCPLLQGRSAIEGYYREWFKGPAKVTAFTFHHLESPVLGDTAFDVGTYRQTLAVGPSGTVDVSGKYTVILKRTGGEWMIAYLIFNGDSPSKMPAAGSR
jgi:uncharacterized protein (TIGR02246 family)